MTLNMLNCIGPIVTCCWPFVIKLTFIESGPVFHVILTENRPTTKLGWIAFSIPFYRWGPWGPGSFIKLLSHATKRCHKQDWNPVFLTADPGFVPGRHSCLGSRQQLGPCCYPLPSRRCWRWKLAGPPVCRDDSELSELWALGCQSLSTLM